MYGTRLELNDYKIYVNALMIKFELCYFNVHQSPSLMRYNKASSST